MAVYQMAQNNFLAKFFEILGRKWIVPVMLFLFDSGEATFTMLKKHLKVTSRALSKKLKLLEALGLVERVVVDNPKKIFYTLSEKGRDISQNIVSFAKRFAE